MPTLFSTMVKFLYPGHKYLGPGNPLRNGKPVDKADQIAEKHDWEYHYAKTKDDVYKSDQRAISAFARDFVSHPNLPSLAGFAGLGIKTATEHLFDTVFYPHIGECFRKWLSKNQ